MNPQNFIRGNSSPCWGTRTLVDKRHPTSFTGYFYLRPVQHLKCPS